MKKPEDIIILYKFTRNHDHMLYCSWDMACDRCNCYFSFWATFCPFIALTAQKTKVSKKLKNSLEISSFYTCAPKIMIRWYMVPKKWCTIDGATDRPTDGWMEKVRHRSRCPHLIKGHPPWLGALPQNVLEFRVDTFPNLVKGLLTNLVLKNFWLNILAPIQICQWYIWIQHRSMYIHMYIIYTYY